MASETLRSVHPTELYTVKQNQIGIFLPSTCHWRWLSKMSMSWSLDRRWDVIPSPLFSNCSLGEHCYWGNTLVYTCFQILFITGSPKHYLDRDRSIRSALPKQPTIEIENRNVKRETLSKDLLSATTCKTMLHVNNASQSCLLPLSW